MTRKNTCALARPAGVLRADTHSGSISSATTRGRKPWHSAATEVAGSHRKPLSFQPVAMRSKDHLSATLQPRAATMPASASSGVGQAGKRKPRPSGNSSIMGRCSKATSA